jgi:hypothetical protein
MNVYKELVTWWMEISKSLIVHKIWKKIKNYNPVISSMSHQHIKRQLKLHKQQFVYNFNMNSINNKCFGKIAHVRKY